MIEPLTYVIYGATGHLSRNRGLLKGTKILCVSRSDWNDESWQHEIKSMMDNVRGGMNEEIFQRFIKRIYYIRGDLRTIELHQKLAEYARHNIYSVIRL